MYRFLTAFILIASLLVQSCSKKINNDPAPPPPGPVENANLKLIPDSMFRVYLKANVCPNAFDVTGKLIDITHSEVKNFNGTIQIDTFTCPRPFVSSLKGIEYFSKMKKLILTNSLVDTLNLSAAMEVDTIKLLINNDLQHVVVSGCTKMRYIRAGDIPAVSLDLSNLPELNYVSLIALKRLNELKTNNDPKLEHIVTRALSAIRTVNVSTNPALRRLYLDYAYALETVDVTHNPKLTHLIATYCPNFKTVDLSKSDSLRLVTFDASGIETLDFSHNPELFSVVMMWSPIKNLNMLANPKLRVLWLDGCTALQTVDLRAQTSFNFYFVDFAKYRNLGISDDDMIQLFPNGWASPVQTPEYSLESPATRAGVNGATINLYGGLRVPQYLDASGLSLTQIKINDAVKDNYSLVMARRVLGSMTPVLITVYAADKTTVLCNDYDPTLFKCN